MSLFAPISLRPAARYMLSRAQYRRMIEEGILQDGGAFELLDGQIVNKDRADAEGEPMSVGKRHRKSVIKLGKLDPEVRKRGCFVQLQQPIALGEHSEPEPDATIVFGDDDDYDDHPRAKDVTCVIEAADHSLEHDRTAKLELYAAARIPVYVILNLADRIAEVYSQPSRGRYRATLRLDADDSLSLPCAKGKKLDVRVADLMP
jgi:Uma2 family endonuclease